MMYEHDMDDSELHLDYIELSQAVAKTIHTVGELSEAPVYAEQQRAADKLPAVFIDLIDASEEYNTSGRRVMVQTIQIMISVDPDMTNIREWMGRVAVKLMAALEYVSWNGTVIHTWDRSWTISGSDLVVSLTARHHHLIINEK